MTNSKTFRLFISSTFNDFRREREVLQTKVFPHAKEYASSKGYTFQPKLLEFIRPNVSL